MKINDQAAIQKLLHERFNQLRSRNSSYSLRAFAKKLGITSGTLSLVMLGKRRASRKLAQKISDKLLLDPVEKENLLSHFIRKKAANGAGTTLKYLQISADQFQLVSEWHYFAILNLTETRGFKADPAWIATRLGLTSARVSDALERLTRLGLLVEENGILRRGAPRYDTTDDVQNAGLKRSHHQTLDLARESLDRDPRELRDFTWLTLPMNLSQLPRAKEIIRKFQDDLSAALQNEGVEATDVYRMAVQLFPLSRPESSVATENTHQKPKSKGEVS